MFEESKARKALEQLSPSLQALDQQLRQVEQISDPIDRIVRFFDTVSRFNDQQQVAPTTVGSVLAAFQKAKGNTQTVEALAALQAHFNNSGRDEFGMNRTKPGEPVTGDKVYLGNISGRWTFTANDWREKLSKDTPYAKEDREIIEGQAASFVASHTGPVHKLIGVLAVPKS